MGLRYRNIIRRSDLGLNNVPWSELLQSYILAPLNAENIDEDSVIDAAHRVEIKLSDEGSQVRLTHRFMQMGNEVCYLIDNDLFTDRKTELHNAINKLDDFNGCAGRIFRWCITERLHIAMELEELPI